MRPWSRSHSSTSHSTVKAVVSRRRLLESCAEENALLFPIHFGAPHVVGIESGPQGFAARFVPGKT